MRKIIAAEFMTIDGVIRREEADGDGFKYGGWFFPVAVRGDGCRGGRAAGQADGSAEESENSPQRHGEHRGFLEGYLVSMFNIGIRVT